MIINMNPYEQEYKYRDIEVQSNLKGYHEPRIKCSPSDIKTFLYNHRQIFVNEVIFDVDCHVREISNVVVDFISSNLIKDKISHQVWDTSRSPHIHCFFENMELYSKNARKLIRFFILKYYSGQYFKWIDKGLVSEDRMIRDFNSVHEITGKKKTLVYDYGKTQFNIIPSPILDKLRVYYNQIENVPLIASNAVKEGNGNPEDLKQTIGLVEFCLNHEFPISGQYKNAHLMKNIAIALYILRFSNKEIKNIDKKITRNCCHRQGEIIGWIDWFKKNNKNPKINWKEISNFYINKIQI